MRTGGETLVLAEALLGSIFGDEPVEVTKIVKGSALAGLRYQRLFDYENVRLEFAHEAMEAIAELAMERKVGARGLRMILEDLMLDLMYHLPSKREIRTFKVTREMVEKGEIPHAFLKKAG